MKSDTTPQRWTRVAAYGLLVEQGSILLCRVSPRLPAHQGRWTLPGGGLEFGEDPRDAMVREVWEETGLHVAPTQLLGVDSLVVNGRSRQVHSIRILYRARVLGGVLRHEVDGTTDLCAWHPLTEAHRLPLVDLTQWGLAFLDSAERET